MALKSKEKSYFPTRAAIGKLFVAAMMDTDPAHILSFTGSLNNTARAALIQKLEDKVDDYVMLPQVMNAICKVLLHRHIQGSFPTKQDFESIDKRIDGVFKSESMARYGLEIYRDILYVDDLYTNFWKPANNTYIADKNAWSVSNDYLTVMQKQLTEVIVRHDLMIFPKGELYNLDERGSSMTQILSAIGDGQQKPAGRFEI